MSHHLVAHLVDYGTEPTAEEIEGYKQEWKTKGFPDLDHGLRHNAAIAVGNERTSSPSGEQMFWLAYIQEIVSDYLGDEEGGSNESCNACHATTGIGCNCIINGRARKGRRLEQCPSHRTHRDCARRMIFEDAGFVELLELLGLDVDYFRQKAKKMKLSKQKSYRTK